MAWRIEEQVVRGEIDNRVRGRVTGRIWFAGREEPVELELEGNCRRDLAGRRLEFTNPDPQPGLPAGFAAKQTGAAGDITAARKAKVPKIPLDQIGEHYRTHRPFPWHLGNALYLEWFSARNGHVVIESAGYQLTSAGDAAWEMTPEEEHAQGRANAEAMREFLQRLTGTISHDETDDPRGQDGANGKRKK
ncbi:MAG: hypothetical protein ACHQ5A_14765 [Opitutales bacterium]